MIRGAEIKIGQRSEKMFIKRIVTAFMIITLAATGAYAATEEPIEPIAETDEVLSELLAKAAENNPQIAAAAQRREAAEKQIDQAQAQFGPKAAIGTGALWLRDGITVSNSALPFDVSVLNTHTYTAAAVLTQTIYAGGSLTAQKKAAKLARDAAIAEEVRTGQGVSNSVRRAYYELRCAQAKEQVAAEAVELSRKHMEQAEKLFKAGVVAKNDVLRSKVEVASSELDEIRAANGTAVALTALCRAVGAELPKETEQSAPLESVLAQGAPADGQGTDADVEEAWENREELKVYSLLSQQAESLARAEKGQLLPQILGSVGYIAEGDNFFPSDISEPAVGIGIYWNIFDNGEIRAKTEEAKAKAKELLFLLEDTKNEIRMEVTQAELNIRSAVSRLEVAQRQLAESREDYRIAVRRYEENVGTNLDALDARLALTNSMSEVVTAVYDIKSAEADLIYAMGK